MKHCSNCGEEISDESKFCCYCGSQQSNIENQNKRTFVYEGQIHKCPNCGETIESFVTECPTCGYEIRSTNAANSVRELERKINEIELTREKGQNKPISIFKKAYTYKELSGTDKQIINIIKSFPIPNTKEDIIEFIILASSNIDYDSYEESTPDLMARQQISEAWVSKMEQAYKKAMISLENEPELEDIKNIYSDSLSRIKHNKNKTWRMLGIIYGVLFFIIITAIIISRIS